MNPTIKPDPDCKEESAHENSSHPPEHRDVGYRKPPEHSRFKKGQSGNPKGRPKGTLNMATVLGRTLREKVTIDENGQRKVVTKLEAAIKQLINKAASGDLGALRMLIYLVLNGEEREPSTITAKDDLSVADKKVLLNVVKRIQSAEQGRTENEDHTD